MIKIYQYFSEGYKSNVTLTYFNKFLNAVEIEPYEGSENLKPLAHFPNHEVSFLNTCKENKIKFIEVSREITFEMFYDKYSYKVGKEEASQQWKKLNKADQLAAFYFIPAYNSRLINSKEARRHPSTYLHKKTWR